MANAAPIASHAFPSKVVIAISLRFYYLRIPSYTAMKIPQTALLFCICLMGILFCGCTEHLDMPSDFKEAKIHGFSLMIPKYVSASKEPSEEALLQYDNEKREYYLILMEEGKDTLQEILEDAEFWKEGERLSHASLVVHRTSIGTKSEIKDVTVAVDTLINGLEASSSVMITELEDIDTDIVYHVTCIEGEQKVYTIVQWTSFRYRERYSETFEQVAHSFKETGR